MINKIFYKKTDHIWVEGIDPQLWNQFFEMLGIQINLTEPALIKQLQQSLQVMSYRITTLGLEKEMTHRYENFDDAIYPFLEQNRLVNEYLQLCDAGGAVEKQRLLLDNIAEALHNCNQSIQWIRDQRKVYGTSLAQTMLKEVMPGGPCSGLDRLFMGGGQGRYVSGFLQQGIAQLSCPCFY